MAYCINCGSPLPPTAKFCNECGTKQEIIERKAEIPTATQTPVERKKEPVQPAPSYTPVFSDDDASAFNYYQEDSKDLASAYAEETPVPVTPVKKEQEFRPVEEERVPQPQVPSFDAPQKNLVSESANTERTTMSQNTNRSIPSGPVFEEVEDEEEEFYLPPITLIEDTEDEDIGVVRKNDTYEEDVEDDVDDFEDVVEKPLATPASRSYNSYEEDADEENMSLSALSSYEGGKNETRQEGRGFAAQKINNSAPIDDPYWDDVLPEIDNEIYQIDRTLIFKAAGSVAALLIVIVYLIYML